MRRINDEWIISIIQKNGPVSVQFFKEILELKQDDGTYHFIKRHLKSLALYKIVERKAIHGIYYYQIPGDTRPINEIKRQDMTARINEEVKKIPEGATVTVSELADKLGIPVSTVRRALRLNKNLKTSERQQFEPTIYKKEGQ